MKEKRFSVEECPLQSSSHCQKKPKTFKGPSRVIRLCLLGIAVPTLLLAIPLYLRYKVYGQQLYPLAMSDMRLLDNKVSTTWCQRQRVTVNATFNAFLLSQPPSISPVRKPLSMVRHLVLEDDTKEYWGFYLLQGSSVTVSTCVRWPGASLIVIRGHKHLHECAYIGDNSSEELDEMMEAIAEGTYVSESTDSSEDSQPVNEPSLMKRHRSEVEFHHPIHRNPSRNHTIDKAFDNTDITDAIVMKKLLEMLQEKTRKKAEKHPHFKRNSTVASGENGNLNIQAPGKGPLKKNVTASEETLNDMLAKLETLGNKGGEILEKLNKKYNRSKSGDTKEDPVIDMRGRHYKKPVVQYEDNIDRARRRKRELILSTAVDLNKNDEENDLGIEEGLNPDGIADHRGTVNETTLNDRSNSEFWSSFSSSEEALLNCAGLILNLPLTPHHKCGPNLTEQQAEETTLANKITYKVPMNGYYFFVFNSENEVQPNYIRVHFHLQKAVYNVSNTVAACSNKSDSCALDLKFFSSEKLVMELPVKDNDSLWNEEFVVISECEPRTAVYAACVITVPVLVILFAFS